jgi:uncharacterized protein with NRDE domain
MCLILFALHAHPEYRLVVAANRDEFYARPTDPAAFWEDAPDVLAGRDRQAGGTWIGITRSGRFAAITNYRDPGKILPHAPSRGDLVADFLRGTGEPEAYLKALQSRASAYNGFNLLIGRGDDLWYYSNVEDQIRKLVPGVYGLSNHLLDTPWPKVVRGKESLRRILAEGSVVPGQVLTELKHTVIAADKDLPDTGVGLEWERLLSPMFIATEGYGTRSSTVVLVRPDGKVHFSERTYFPSTAAYEDRSYVV